MRKKTYLSRNKHGIYCYRYTLPKWHLRNFPQHKKCIFLSLKTDDHKIAVLRAEQLYSLTRILLTKLKKVSKFDSMSERKTINSLISDFRDYLEHADPMVRKAFGAEVGHAANMWEYFDERLVFIDEYGLLDSVKRNFDNVDLLYNKAKDIERRKEELEIQAVVDEQLASVKPTQVNDNRNNDSLKAAEITLSEVLQGFLRYKDAKLQSDTLKELEQQIQFLIDTVGDIRVVDFTKAELQKFRTALSSRTYKRSGKNMPVLNSRKNLYLDSCGALFDFAIANYDIKIENVFKNKLIKFLVNEDEIRDAVLFKEQELEAMFSHDIFTKGAFGNKPYKYWAPLIALYTGSRLSEISQLRTVDIIVEDGIYCISHNLQPAGFKKIKNKKPRLVPIHPVLIDLGFREFVNLISQKKYQWEEGNSSHLLFYGLTFDAKKKSYRKNASYWFNGGGKTRPSGFKHSVGLEFKDNEKKDFHSFRHTFSTAALRAGVNDQMSYQMTGHREDKKLLGGAGAGYRHGFSIQALYEEICKVDYGVALDNVNPFFEIGGKKACRIMVDKKKK